MTTAQRHRRDRPDGAPSTHAPATSLASVYVDMAATRDAEHAAVGALPTPHGVTDVRVDDRSVTDTFGCRIAIDLTGPFDQDADGPRIARLYAHQLSIELGVPAHALYDLLRTDSNTFLY
jgi:hypothetical protein